MRNPLNKPYRVTSPFGQRMLGGKPDMHNGIDLVPGDGKHPTELFATVDGTVADLRSTVLDSHAGLNVSSMVTGNYVNIRTKDGCTVIYRHLRANSVCVRLGQAIKVGDKLGVMGATGQSTGVHLHYEIRDSNNVALNPALYLDNDKTLGNSGNSSPIKVGDKVKVINTVTYTGGSFKTYFPEYDVIQINGDRAVIGIGNTITAPIHINNIKKA